MHILTPNPLRSVLPLARDVILIFQQQHISTTPKGDLLTYNDLIQHSAFVEANYYQVAEEAGNRFLLIDRVDTELVKEHFPQAIIKSYVTKLAENVGHIILLAHHLHHWRKTHVYCSCCGHLLIDKQDERARQCIACQFVVYPRISPCIIVVIRRGKQLLLARNSQFTPHIYGCLAGFVEAGESAETAVHREVLEETGIQITNLCYVKSQAWPFPDALMLAFTADYAGGELVINTSELQDAKWFNYNELPQLPMSYSIARQLIELQVNQIHNNY